VIENNSNKDIIILMSIRQGFRQPKRRKEKESLLPQFVLIAIEGSLLEEKELKHVPNVFFYLLSIETLYY
jgi:hypothetical protein